MNADSHLFNTALPSIELFTGLSATALRMVAKAARVRRIPKATRIFNQGDRSIRAHVLIEGGVRISQAGSDGTQVVLRFIGPREMFGAVALFTDKRYPAEAVTLSESLEASWSNAELLNLLERYPQISINIIEIIGKRLQEAQQRIRELSTRRAEQRIARALLRLARQGGSSTAYGREIEFPLRRKDIADISGTTLHTVSRILASWGKAGFLISQNQHLILRAPSEILRIASNSAS